MMIFEGPMMAGCSRRQGFSFTVASRHSAVTLPRNPADMKIARSHFLFTSNRNQE
jgi:hypothetical protein